MDNQALVAVFTLYMSWITLTTATGNVSLTIVRKDSSPHHLLITWTLPEGYQISTFEAKIQKKHSDSIIIGPPLNGSAVEEMTEYKIPDLMTNSKYEVCLYMDLVASNVSSGLPLLVHVECATMKTPPSIRADSLLVLFAVIAYLLLMVLLGYLCWRWAHKKQEDSEEEDEAESVEEKIENGETRPFLLNSPPPASAPQRPRSAIEDEDIPFITPTWDQLASERKIAP